MDPKLAAAFEAERERLYAASKCEFYLKMILDAMKREPGWAFTSMELSFSERISTDMAKTVHETLPDWLGLEKTDSGFVVSIYHDW